MARNSVTGKALTDVLYGKTAARKVVTTDRHNKVDSLDVTEVKVGGTAITATAAELNKLAGSSVTTAELDALAGITYSPVQVAEMAFIETTGAGVYTASVTLPGGAFILDIVLAGIVLWNATTSATMKVGDVANDDGFFIDIDLKATDLLVGENISLGYTGGLEGADVDGGESAGDHVRRRYLATPRVISGVVTTVGAAGSAGRTFMVVVFALPSAPITATKV